MRDSSELKALRREALKRSSPKWGAEIKHLFADMPTGTVRVPSDHHIYVNTVGSIEIYAHGRPVWTVPDMILRPVDYYSVRVTFAAVGDPEMNYGPIRGEAE